MEIRRFTKEMEPVWNQFVHGAKMGTFLFNRQFMDYHSDRFTDHSLVMLDNGKLLTLLPANSDGSTLISHGGLSYGGFITDSRMHLDLMLSVFEAFLKYAVAEGFSRIYYKPVPHFYHTVPAEEDLYALHRFGANLVRVDASTAIHIPDRLTFSKSKRQGAAKARNKGVVVRETNDWVACWDLLSDVLKGRHAARPTHTLGEIQLLSERFPREIRLFGAFLGEQMVSALVLFDCQKTAHVQYIASGEMGRACGGVDLIVDHLLENLGPGREWVDFGISTVEEGRILNAGLARQKEMFGGRTVVYQQYSLAL